MYTKRGFKLAAKNLPALPITPGINTIHYYVSVTHLHGVDSNSQSRIVPIHFIFLTAFIVCRAVLLGCPNSMDSHSYDENEYTHTDHNYDCGHTWNNWNKKWKRQHVYSYRPSCLQNTEHTVYFSLLGTYFSATCLGLQSWWSAHLPGQSVYNKKYCKS